MKKVFLNRFVAFGLFSAVALGFSTTTMATEEPNPSAVELKFLGKVKDQPLFLLSVNGKADADNEYTVTIRDMFNDVLYKGVLKGAKASKKYLLNTEEVGAGGVVFEISDKSSDKPVVFEISNNTRYVEDVVVNKVK